MKKLICASLLFAALCPAAAAQSNTPPDAAWRVYAPEGKEFSVELPGVPQHKVEMLTRPGATATFHMYHLTLDSEIYFVGMINVPPSTKGPDERLELGINFAAKQFVGDGGKELSRRKFTAPFGCPGVAWVGASAQVPAMEAHAFVSHDRIYLVVWASSDTGPAARRVAGRFFDSFNVPGAPCGEKKPE